MVTHQRRPLRRGLTLIELVTVIGIIGLLAAIIVPAVQHVRETARRTECVNHLDQIGTALQNHMSRTGRIPPSREEREAIRTGHDGSVFVHLLPELDQRAIYDTIKQSGCSQSLSPVIEARPCRTLPMSLCPSDGAEFGTNYRFNWGPAVHWASDSRDSTLAGPFQVTVGYSGRSLAEITDGLSQTAIASESLVGGGDRNTFDPERDAWMHGLENAGSSVLTNAMLQDLCASAESAPQPFYPFSGWFWTLSGYDHTFYNHVLGPNSPRINCNGIREWVPEFPGNYLHESLAGLQKASSVHPGGVNLLLLDGSVRFVNESIDPGVWRAYGSSQAGDDVAGL